MSLILEALRKSEAQRRLGQAPDLMSQAPSNARPQRRALPAWPWFMAGLVLVALTAWWLGRQHASDEATPVASNGGAAAPANAEATAATPIPASRPSPDSDAGAPATIDATQRQPAPIEPAQRQPTTLPARPPAVQPSTEPAARPSPPPSAAIAEGPASAEELERLRARLEAIAQRNAGPDTGGLDSARNTPADEPEQAARAAIDSTAVESAPVAPASVQSAPGDPAPDPAGGDVSAPAATVPAEPITAQGPSAELPRFAELSLAERGDTPELSFSLHVFSDDPQRRFVIFKDRRLGEGAQISARVRLVEIRRDGALVEIDGRPVLVSRP